MFQLRRTLALGKPIWLSLSWVPDGSVGRSVELDLWPPNRYFYLSVGVRYGGKPWLRWGMAT